ncbi:pectate lyase [Pontibacter sp. 172403-2]|uniref:FlgD immunoglobulin-like domain containing protein n=1 Tax=Pontibacter rufus TaxID=2791028 RepID=UPI0018AFCFB4|nr:FlgD immunoglobulin-like domain containing protein [Pontibacter sp. 172403-2]MBF9255052.1 pectate lyase [Pontibacter sp. 172403-2]
MALPSTFIPALRHLWRFALTIVLLLCGSQAATAQQLAFPGAEGFGRYTSGGRGGAVYEVTNLNDSGAGSLRDAVNKTGARTIVFRVSGTIQLETDLLIRNGNLTIAGQTAPGDGICLKRSGIVVDADNVIIRYLRIRPGDIGQRELDAIWGRGIKNTMIDHCSFSWSIDETASFYANENFTMQWCIISESLRNSVHSKGAHGYGGIWGGKNASFHHNLLANHDSRNPRLGEEAGKAFALADLVDVRNNVIFNWGGNSAYGGEAMNVNIVNNYYKPGPVTTRKERILSIDKNKIEGTEVYGIWGKFFIDGNFVEGSTRATADNWTYGVYNQFHSSYGTIPDAEKEAMRITQPHPVANNVTTHTAQEAYEKVLQNAGASLHRDAVDERVVSGVRSNTFTATGSNGSTNGIIDSQNDVGGWPDLTSAPAPADADHDGMPDSWEQKYALNPNNAADRNNDNNSNGYTNLEEYLNGSLPQAEVTGLKEDVSAGSSAFVYPNPFSESATFRFLTRQAAQVTLSIFDTTGKQVATLLDKPLPPGEYELQWDGTGRQKHLLSCGLYFTSLQVGQERVVQRLALQK